MIEIDKIYNEDCLEGMKRIADGAVDSIITDLPYGTTACAWDSVIPFEPLWEQFKRVAKPNAAIVLFGSEPFSSALRMSALGLYKYDWIWVKNHATGFQHAKNMPMKDFETISVFSRGSMGHANLLGDKRMTYNPQGTKACHIEYHNAKAKFGGTVGARPSHKDHIVTEECNYPRTTLYFDKDPDCLHPTQKPVDLLRYLILTYTNVGGGSSRRNDWLGHNGCGGTDGKAPLHRLRDQQGVFRHRTRSYRQYQATADTLLNIHRTPKKRQYATERSI